MVRCIIMKSLTNDHSLVAQSPVVWYASVRDNLDPHGIHTDQEIWSTLDRVGIGSAILELPEKLETFLEDEGSLSTGQVPSLSKTQAFRLRLK